MIHDDDDNESALLRTTLEAFLAHGFHAAQITDLEAATGRTWPDLCARYVDKEGLFLRAAEHALADGSAAAQGRDAEVLAMVERLERVNGNPRLRAIHKPALRNLRAIADGPGDSA